MFLKTVARMTKPPTLVTIHISPLILVAILIIAHIAYIFTPVFSYFGVAFVTMLTYVRYTHECIQL